MINFKMCFDAQGEIRNIEKMAVQTHISIEKERGQYAPELPTSTSKVNQGKLKI